MEEARKASVVVVRPAPSNVAQTPAWYRPLTAQCIVQEAKRQGIAPIKIATVLRVEGGRVGMFSLNSNGTYDIGPMQINTVHLKDLSRLYGLAKESVAQLLAYDGCFNVAVGAWMLRKRTDEVNGDFWRAIGRYHSKTPSKAGAYIRKAQAALNDIMARSQQNRDATRTQSYAMEGASNQKGGGLDG